jgi:hypothetical protein
VTGCVRLCDGLSPRVMTSCATRSRAPS